MKVLNFLFFILFIGESIASYRFVNLSIPEKYITKLSALVSFDNKTIFLIVFILPYIFFFLIWMIPFFVKKKERESLVLSFSFFFTSSLVFIFYLLFQTPYLAPKIPPHSLYDKIILFIYSINRPQGLFPIQHIVLLFLSNLVLFKIRRGLAYLFIPLSIGIVYFLFIIGQISSLSLLTSLTFSLIGFFVFILFS